SGGFLDSLPSLGYNRRIIFSGGTAAMFSIYHQQSRWRRREWLCIGGVSCLGLSTSTLHRALAEVTPRSRRANACIFIFLFGGPSHIDLWDMKPDAPAEVRGEFKPIQTRTAGIEICEHLPKLAQ